MQKVIVVTGGTSGIGLETVDLFSKNGYKVYSISKSLEKITEIKESYPLVTFLCGDVRDTIFLKSAFDSIEKAEGKIDALVNNAGIIHAGGLETLPLDDWKDTYSANVESVFLCSKLALPCLKRGDNASIINVSSISSKMTGSSIAYSSCKAAVDMMTKSMAKELAKYNIRVNSVNPGIVATGFQIHNGLIGKEQYDDFLEKVSVDYPLGIGTAEDVAKLIAFLVSDDTRWITGGNYVVDGGRSVNI